MVQHSRRLVNGDWRPVASAAAVGLVISSLATGVLAMGPETAAAAGKARPNLTTVSVADPPRRADPGETFTIRSTVKNTGRAEAGPSKVRVLLSKDKSTGRRDLTVASGRIKALRPRHSLTIDATVTVPQSAVGSYWVITCTDAGRTVRESDERDNCRSSARKVNVTGGLDAALSGTLSFTDIGQSSDTSSTTTWERYAETKIAMHVTGPHNDPDFVDVGSTYSFEGERIEETPGPPCTYTIVRTEAGGGPLKYTGDPFTDDIQGYILATNLSRIHLAVWTRHDVTTDFASCNGTTTQTNKATMVTSMTLEKISSTISSITYEVTSYKGDMNSESPWDSVEGTLTLARDPEPQPRVGTATMQEGTEPVQGLAPAPGSIVFIRDHDVWLSRSDGSGQVRVTRDGTATTPYQSPSQSDTGVIAVGHGNHIVTMRQNGTVLRRLDPPALTSSVSHPLDGPPVHVAISPDGARIAYTFSSYQCPVGTTCGARQATGITDADRVTSAAEHGQTYYWSPSWVGNRRTLQSGGYLHQVMVKDLGKEPVHWFDDKDVAAESTDLGDVELSPDGEWLGAVRGYDAGAHITWYSVTGDARSGPPPAAPKWECLTSTLGGLNNPTWAPDSSALAWGEPDGIWVSTDLAGCGTPALLIEDGNQPDWSAAPLDPGPSAFTLDRRPTVTGKARVGSTLRATAGSWSPDPAGTSYQWLRGGSAVPGATRRTYRPTARDVGKVLSVRVTVEGPCCPPKKATSRATKRVRR